MEFTQDPFDASKGVSGGPSLHTDGEWIWRKDFAYYVENYRVAVASEFVQHVLDKSAGEPNAPYPLEVWEAAVAAYDAVVA